MQVEHIRILTHSIILVLVIVSLAYKYKSSDMLMEVSLSNVCYKMTHFINLYCGGLFPATSQIRGKQRPFAMLLQVDQEKEAGMSV